MPRSARAAPAIAQTSTPLSHAAEVLSSIDAARTALNIGSHGPAPLFFTDSALAHVPLHVQSVILQTAEAYSATVFYAGFDNSGLQGQLWMDRGPTAKPDVFGGCVGDPITGPMTLGRFHNVYLGQCDIDFVYQFDYRNRLYRVASKYYGGLTPKTLAPIVAGLTPSAPIGSGCPAYGVVDSRGSGEPEGRLSPPAAAVLAELQARHPGERVGDYWNPYPAVGLTDSPREWANALGAALHIGPLGAYHGSVADGKRWLRDFVPRELRTCPAIKLVLVGYSQGAQVTGDVYQRDVTRAERRNIFAVLLFGDPYFNPSDRRADRGSYDHHRAGALGERRTVGGDPRVESFCHHHDPVCQASGQPAAFLIWGFKQHENYPSDARRAAGGL